MKKTTSWSRNNLKVQSDSGELFGLVIVDTCCLCNAAISVWITVSHFGHTSLINDLKAVVLSSFSMSEEEWTRLNFNWFVKQVSTCSLIFVLIGCLWLSRWGEQSREHAASRPVLQKTQANPDGVLAVAAPAAGASLRKESLRGRSREEAAGQWAVSDWDAGRHHG